MSSKPFSYEPLKTVLHNIKADKRFEIFQKMPTIRNAEKLVPLKINKLSFGLLEFTVNQTIFGLHIVRKPSLYQEFISLAINGRVIEYVEHRQTSFQRASDYFMTMFFGGRSDPISVNQFMFNGDHLLTFPPNAKLQVQHLIIRHGIREGIMTLSSVLTESSFPLQSLKIFVNYSTKREFRDKVVQEAKKVIIVQNSCSFLTNRANNWNFLPANTHFENTSRLKPNDFAALIRHWKVSGAAPGRRCSVGLSNDQEDEWFGIRTMRTIQEEFDVVREDGVNTIPINQSSEVRVSVKNDGPQDEISRTPTSMLVLEVVAKT